MGGLTDNIWGSRWRYWRVCGTVGIFRRRRVVWRVTGSRYFVDTRRMKEDPRIGVHCGWAPRFIQYPKRDDPNICELDDELHRQNREFGPEPLQLESIITHSYSRCQVIEVTLDPSKYCWWSITPDRTLIETKTYFKSSKMATGSKFLDDASSSLATPLRLMSMYLERS